MAEQLVITVYAGGHLAVYTADCAVCARLEISAPSTSGMRTIAWLEGEGEAPNRELALVPARGLHLEDAAGAAMGKAPLAQDGERFFTVGSPAEGAVATVYSRPASAGSRTYGMLAFTRDCACVIGRADNADLRYASPFVSSSHARLAFAAGAFTLEDLGSANGTYVNGRALVSGVPRSLELGDTVRILDLTFMVGSRYLVMNSPSGFSVVPQAAVRPLDRAALAQAAAPAGDKSTDALAGIDAAGVSGADAELPLFYPAPRLMRVAHARAYAVDGPPARRKRDETPAAMRIGPSFLMALTSVFMIASAVSRLGQGADVLSVAPMMAMSISMVAGTVLWPAINRRYEKRRDAREEMARESAYTDYLNAIDRALRSECADQEQVLRAMRPAIDDLLALADTGSPELMDRTTAHRDYLDVRVGLGEMPSEADIRWPQRSFTMDDDHLLSRVFDMAEHQPGLNDVPLVFNPSRHAVAGVLGPRAQAWAFMRGMVVQLCTLMSYQDVKLMLVADSAEEAEWGFMRGLRHLADDAGRRRFLATNAEELLELTMFLERELEHRRDVRAASPADYGVSYVVICANKALTERSDTIARLARLRESPGISLMFLGTELRDLPRECSYVIDLAGIAAVSEDASAAAGEALVAGLGPTSSLSQTATGPLLASTGSLAEARPQRPACMFDREDVSASMQRFTPDIELSATRADAWARSIARVRLDIPGQRTALPDTLGFLEMMHVGNVGALALAQRWAEADASRTLAVPVGVDAQGEPFILNIHERAHGPHGLIAGTTGSGKSEFIITYILSLAAAYPPDQVSFVLIDYKGGGLAGAFENERVRLPHVAGTITNLDGAAIARSLVSIKSELKRRQAVLAAAREITGEATMDIYKYLSYYLRGRLTEPLPHLLIVADEFAELKDQQSEFMDELMSAARIGRSLGVHLVLATQKPSGVVNDQIRSNMRFKVCLKVADAADSKEMIDRPDAAAITGPGRFYLLVGYNEYFAAGQAAYAGAAYQPAERWEPRIDDAVELVGNSGAVLAACSPERPALAASSGPEINAVLAAISAVAHEADVRTRPLWLAPLEENIPLASLEQRYGDAYQGVGPISLLGEIDMPARQERACYTVDWSATGNLAIYGASGTGTDELAATALFSLAQRYPSESVRFYIADFESGILSSLAALPSCGGVVRPDDAERMANLFKLLEGELTKRRELMAAEGADAVADLPHIVFALANIAAFYELFAPLEERLGVLARDGMRCGIHLLITANTATAMRMRLRACFTDCVALSFNDPGDYNTLFGSKPPVIPVRVPRRGVVKLDKELCEFQGAALAPAGMSERDAISAAAARLAAEGVTVAPRIPVLPARVHLAEMYGGSAARRDLPIGYSKLSVEPVWFPLEASTYLLVLGDDLAAINGYTRALYGFLAQSDMDYRVLDPDKVLGAVDDPLVAQTSDEIALHVETLLADGAELPQLLVCLSIVKVMAALPTDLARKLQGCIESERFAGSMDILLTSEFWRVRTLYDKWFKVLTAYGNGVWIGNGFADQNLLRPAQMKGEYRLPIRKDEGYVTLFGACDPVRLIGRDDDEDQDDGKPAQA